MVSGNQIYCHCGPLAQLLMKSLQQILLSQVGHKVWTALEFSKRKFKKKEEEEMFTESRAKNRDENKCTAWIRTHTYIQTRLPCFIRPEWKLKWNLLMFLAQMLWPRSSMAMQNEKELNDRKLRRPHVSDTADWSCSWQRQNRMKEMKPHDENVEICAQ